MPEPVKKSKSQIAAGPCSEAKSSVFGSLCIRRTGKATSLHVKEHLIKMPRSLAMILDKHKNEVCASNAMC